MADSTPVVLDAWPLVEYFYGREPSASAVGSLFRPDSPTVPRLSAVTLSEVYYVLAQNRGSRFADDAIAAVRDLARVDAAGPHQALAAGWLKCTYHMSLGDTYAAVAAVEHEAALWTGDAELLFDGCPWDVEDLRDDHTREQQQQAVAAGRKKIGPRAGHARPEDPDAPSG